MNNEENRDSEKIDARDIKIVKKNKFLMWLDNFWYHYKWPVIIVTFFLIVGVVCISQMITNKKEDVTVMYAGPYQLSRDERAEIEVALTRILPKDYNNDGKGILDFCEYSIYSEEEFESINEAYTTEEGNHVPMVNTSTNYTNYQNYTSYMQTGACSVYFLSEYLYEKNLSVNTEIMVPLSDVFGDELPQGAMDNGYGVRLIETPLYDIPALKVLPKDTIVCLGRRRPMGQSEKEYSFAYDYFKTLLTYTGE